MSAPASESPESLDELTLTGAASAGVAPPVVRLTTSEMAAE